jgi:hypothetical protein
MAELIGGSGYDDVQATEPSNPKIGDTWLDTSNSEATGKIYADLGNGADWQILPVQDELQSGRTRELLMLLQDNPVPEVVDPLNLQAGLSSNYQQSGSDYELNVNTSTATREDDDGTSTFGNDNEVGLIINPNNSMRKIETTISQNTTGGEEASVIRNSDDTVLESKDITGNSPGDTLIFDDIGELSSGTEYRLTLTQFSGDIGEYGDPSFPYTSTTIDIQTGYRQGNFSDGKTNSRAIAFKTVKGFDADNDGNVTDRFSAPTTAPADFKQWDAIRAIDVTTGGSSSADPVEFEILDSTDTALNSSRIPKSRVADEPFTMRNRVYSESATSDGQSDYQIATTGDGGHFGIPILTVVTVTKNGSVIDSANWSFDGDTTVTIDTSNVTIASGDTIDIKYDFDVFDSALQPRAYLSRESTSETSPSISHFKYEYVI